MFQFGFFLGGGRDEDKTLNSSIGGSTVIWEIPAEEGRKWKTGARDRGRIPLYPIPVIYEGAFEIEGGQVLFHFKGKIVFKK